MRALHVDRVISVWRQLWGLCTLIVLSLCENNSSDKELDEPCAMIVQAVGEDSERMCRRVDLVAAVCVRVCSSDFDDIFANSI